MGEVSVFCFLVEKIEQLEANWENIRDFIAMYFQSNLESEFSRWNLYLLFVCATEIPIKLKYQIENDTISSRKIVIENYKNDGRAPDDNQLGHLISKHITNDDIQLEQSSDLNNYSDSPIFDSKVLNFIQNKSIAAGKKSEKTENLKKLYEEVLLELKDED